MLLLATPGLEDWFEIGCTLFAKAVSCDKSFCKKFPGPNPTPKKMTCVYTNKQVEVILHPSYCFGFWWLLVRCQWRWWMVTCNVVVALLCFMYLGLRLSCSGFNSNLLQNSSLSGTCAFAHRMPRTQIWILTMSHKYCCWDSLVYWLQWEHPRFPIPSLES